jgi:hypothetical protein
MKNMSFFDDRLYDRGAGLIVAPAQSHEPK